nr:MAG TPA: hypothetical protein [Bacteriophage sp.]
MDARQRVLSSTTLQPQMNKPTGGYYHVLLQTLSPRVRCE